MEPFRLWASVRFTTRNGDSSGLLTAAARDDFHLSAVTPLPGGFCACCAAWRYCALAKLARRYRVRLRVQTRDGMFFRIRPLLHRRGLWCGLLLFLPLLLWLQGAIWATDFTTLSPGQQARAAIILREQQLSAGDFVTEEKLTAGEYALLQSGEFSWASLNFSKGRLIVEAATAKPVPEIAAGTLHGLRAKAAGTVLETNLISGTMLVTPGQTVEAGQGLIGTARAERDGTLIFQPAAGRVLAQVEWEFAEELPLIQDISQLTGQKFSVWKLHFAGKTISLPAFGQHEERDRSITRHLQPELLGLMFPCSLEETTHYKTRTEPLSATEEQLLTQARFHSRKALFAAWPDAEIRARKEDFSSANESFTYRVCYTITADICTEKQETAAG